MSCSAQKVRTFVQRLQRHCLYFVPGAVVTLKIDILLKTTVTNNNRRETQTAAVAVVHAEVLEADVADTIINTMRILNNRTLNHTCQTCIRGTFPCQVLQVSCLPSFHPFRHKQQQANERCRQIRTTGLQILHQIKTILNHVPRCSLSLIILLARTQSTLT